jgi:hypothetical protein
MLSQIWYDLSPPPCSQSDQPEISTVKSLNVSAGSSHHEIHIVPFSSAAVSHYCFWYPFSVTSSSLALFAERH